MTKPNQETGKSRLQVAYEIRDLTGVISTELKSSPEYPWQLKYIWGWFIDLSRGRSAGGMAANAINWSDMYSYFYLIGVRPMRWEINVLKLLDNAFLESRVDNSEGVIASAAGMPKPEFKNG